MFAAYKDIGRVQNRVQMLATARGDEVEAVPVAQPDFGDGGRIGLLG